MRELRAMEEQAVAQATRALAENQRLLQREAVEQQTWMHDVTSRLAEHAGLAWNTNIRETERKKLQHA